MGKERDDETAAAGPATAARLARQLRRTERERRLVGLVGRKLAESLDTQSTVTQIARLVIPEFADWSAVATFDDPHGPVLEALECAEPAKQELARRILDTYRVDLAAPHGIGRVIRTGESELVEEITPAFLEGLGPTPLCEALRALEATSFVCVPMLARGRIVGAVYMAMAGSGRRYSAANLELANELASLSGLAIDNARLLREAREAIRAREEFLSLASHELRTPLTTVLTQIQLALRLLGGAPDARVREALERAERQGQRLRKMVNDVLALAQFVSGNFRLVPESMDLVQVSRDVVATLPAATGLAVPPIAVTAPASVPGCWDRPRMRQAILALLDNALVYGGGQPIDVVVEERGPLVRWSVIDRGPGLDPAALARLFQPFRRGSRTGQVRGLGLGLFITRRIVEAHGGRIGYEGDPGTSTFWFEVPRNSAALTRTQEESGPPAVVG